MTNTTDAILERVIAARVAAGLVLMFEIPGRDKPFICYPKDEASRQEWLEQAEAEGWRQI